MGVVFEQEGGGAAHVVVGRRDAEEVGGNAGCVPLCGSGARAQAREKLLRGSSGGRLPDDVKEERLVGGVDGAALGRGEFVKERHATRHGCRRRWIRHEMRWRLYIGRVALQSCEKGCRCDRTARKAKWKGEGGSRLGKGKGGGGQVK